MGDLDHNKVSPVDDESKRCSLLAADALQAVFDEALQLQSAALHRRAEAHSDWGFHPGCSVSADDHLEHDLEKCCC